MSGAWESGDGLGALVLLSPKLWALPCAGLCVCHAAVGLLGSFALNLARGELADWAEVTLARLRPSSGVDGLEPAEGRPASSGCGRGPAGGFELGAG